MTDRSLTTLGRTIATVTVGLGIAALVVRVNAGLPGVFDQGSLQELAGTLIIPAVVLISVPRVPRNGSLWAFAVVGLALGFVVLGDTVAEAVSGVTSEDVINLSVVLGPADLPLSAALGLTSALTLWIPSFVFIPTLVLLLFPDGRFPEPHRRWRWVGILAIATAVIGMVVTIWQYLPSRSESYALLTKEASVANVIAGVASMLFMLLALAAIVGYALKWKRAAGDSRMQYRWVGFAFFGFAIWSVLSIAISPLDNDPVKDIASWVMILAIPATYSIAILKYRLYGIDVAISKTVTYGILAAFITGVYAFMVVGIGSLFGGADEPNLALSIAAVAIVAVAFEPLRKRAQHWANVMVYGKRATPYEVLASATSRLSDTRDPDRTLAEVAKLVVDGTGASEAIVWLRVAESMHPRASSPVEAIGRHAPIPIGDDPLPEGPDGLRVAVQHRGELLGALSIAKERGESASTADKEVLENVAAGAGVLLRNLSLNAELAERADQLRLSRRRLVATHDAERHRLERDLHDGAQQLVVALKVKLGIARTLAEREGAEEVSELVAALAETTQGAVDGMRAVAHGIYPPLLEAEGLDAALNAAKRTIPVPVEIVAARLGRYQRSIEESVYFAVLGVIAEATDAGAPSATVSLSGSDAAVAFSVRYPGTPTDLTPVEDRVDALGGSFHVDTDSGMVGVRVTIPTSGSSMVDA